MKIMGYVSDIVHAIGLLFFGQSLFGVVMTTFVDVVSFLKA